MASKNDQFLMIVVKSGEVFFLAADDADLADFTLIFFILILIQNSIHSNSKFYSFQFDILFILIQNSIHSDLKNTFQSNQPNKGNYCRKNNSINPNHIKTLTHEKLAQNDSKQSISYKF
jgi:hypothetical protein